MSSSRSAEGAYESYIVRLYRRDGLRIVGMVEVVESGEILRFSDAAGLMAIMGGYELHVEPPAELENARGGRRGRSVRGDTDSGESD